MTGSGEAREALARQRRLYEAILTNTPDLAYVIDLEHRFIYANEGLLKMWGKTLDEAIGRTFLELGYEPWHAAMHDREIDEVAATKRPIRGEVPFTGTFGRRIYDYLMVPVVGADGQVEAVAGTTRDVTEHKKSEEALRQARSQLETALLAGEIGTYVWDIAADRLYGDSNFTALFGVPLVDGAAPLSEFVAAIHPDDRPHVIPRVERALDTGGDYEAEYRIIAGERERWVIARGKVEFDGEGRPVRFPGVLLDITERKLAEKALQESDRRKDEFLATLSHELRNPLAPIRQSITLLKAQNVAEHDAARALDVIDRQSQHMAWLLDDLLDVSRITRGVLELRKEVLELAAVIDSGVEVARPLIDSRRHTLVLELPDEPVRFEADGLRLAQVVSNLLTNAAKYTDPGGRIRLRAEARGAQLVLRVTDNGIGINDAMLARMFEIFSQEKSATGWSRGGLGIGLALVRGLVELHGGTVEARSAGPGHGSEFTVRLPLDRTAAPREAAADARRRPAGSTRKILVADDNRDAAESMGLLLQIAGHDVRIVHDGIAALDTGAAFQPDVALVDIGMPELSGYEVAERARAEPWGQRTLLIAVTGWGQESDKRRALEAGFDHHLTKPVEQEVLEGLLAREPVHKL